MFEARCIARLGLALAVSCGGSPSPVTGPVTGEAARANLLLILADDLGWADLGVFGAEEGGSPSLDRLAGEGARFTSFYAGAPVCSPSRAALFTGLYAHQTGIRQPVQSTRPGNRLRADVVLVPERLRSAGYRTALVGKWHLGWERPDLPTDRGFDAFYGFLLASRYRVERLLEGERVVAAEGDVTALVTDRACSFLEEHARDHAEEPFFLAVAHLAPHAPVDEAASFVPERVEAARARGLDPARAVYRAVVEHLDAEVGRLLAKLDALGLAEETLVVFASDNGPPPGEAASLGGLRGGKWGLYEGGLRVPCIVRWPGRVPAGLVVDEPAALWDLAATFCDAAGVAQPAEGPARSLLPLLRPGSSPGPGSGSTSDARALVWRHGPSEAVRLERWKLLRERAGDAEAALELYDVALDPGETRDLAAEHPDVVRELEALLEEAVAGW